MIETIQQYIPEADFNHFIICNSSNSWVRHSFYTLKTKILHQYGIFDEHDLQIVKAKCNACEGTGIYKRWHWDWLSREKYVAHTEPCNRCNKGIYETRRFALKRWILNDKIFHEPIGRVTDNGSIIDIQDNIILDTTKQFISYRNTIHGIIKHQNPKGESAFYSYLQLLKKYDEPKYYHEINSFCYDLKTRAKAKFNKIAKRHLNIIDAIAEYLKVNTSTR